MRRHQIFLFDLKQSAVTAFTKAYSESSIKDCYADLHQVNELGLKKRTQKFLSKTIKLGLKKAL